MPEMMQRVHGAVAYRNISKAAQVTIDKKPVSYHYGERIVAKPNIGYRHCKEGHTYAGGYTVPYQNIPRSRKEPGSDRDYQ